LSIDDCLTDDWRDEAGLHRVLTATQQRSLGDAGTNIEELLQ